MNPVDGYYHYLNNVSVNTMGIRLDSTAVAMQYLDCVKVCGNQVWNTGHMDQGKLIYSEGSLVLWSNHYGECIIEDNVFYGTENGYESNALFNIWFYENHHNPIPRLAITPMYSMQTGNSGTFLCGNAATGT